ncbi:MAG: NUDIX hydrolase [Puniceicoccales bacterium]|jgi:8-oxo-dGTP pyrophosphatase MutT (NUDIX family)|nr:NUDIX hydrolase [Puniceicoccales bacterium]
MPIPAVWTTLDETPHAECKVFQVFRRRSQHPHDKREGVFFVIHSTDWVLALPVTVDGRIVLVRQYRHGTKTLSWEPPGGIIDPGEEPLQAAQRELLEETGYIGKNARLVGSCTPNPAIFNNTSHFVLVEDCTPSGVLDLDPNEEIEVGLFTAREAEHMVLNGEIHHVIAQTSILRLRHLRPDLF